MRATARIAGVSINTVSKLLVEGRTRLVRPTTMRP